MGNGIKSAVKSTICATAFDTVLQTSVVLHNLVTALLDIWYTSSAVGTRSFLFRFAFRYRLVYAVCITAEHVPTAIEFNSDGSQVNMGFDAFDGGGKRPTSYAWRKIWTHPDRSRVEHVHVWRPHRRFVSYGSIR